MKPGPDGRGMPQDPSNGKDAAHSKDMSPGLTKRRVLKLLVRVIGSAGLLAVLVYMIDLAELYALVGRVDPYWLAAAAIILVGLRFLMALRWHYILSRHDIPAGLAEAIRVTFLATTLTPLFPGGLGGDVFRGFYIVRKYGKAAAVAATVLLDRAVGVYSMLLLASLGAVAAWWMGRTVGLFFVLVLLQILIVFGWGGAVFFRRKVAGWRPSSSLLGKIQRQLVAVLLNLTDLPLLRRVVPGMIVLSLAMQMGRCLVFLCLFRAFGVDLAIVYYVVYIPLVFLASMMPVSIGGLGVREGALVVFFVDLGVPIEICVATGILLHGMLISLSALVAAVWFTASVTARDRTTAPPPG